MASVGREYIMLIDFYAAKNGKSIQNSVWLGNKSIILPRLRAGTSYKMINQ